MSMITKNFWSWPVKAGPRRLPIPAVVLALGGLALGGLALASAAQAAVPTSAAVEGVLASAGGGPAADGNYVVVFGIYAAETGGSAVWTEGPATVVAKGGQFSYMLGSKTPLSASGLSLQNAWLGMQIGTDPELPRRPLAATLFALRAAVAESLDCSACIKVTALDAGVLQPYAKTSDLAPFAKSADLGAYVKATDLGAYAKASDLAGYAKTTDLTDYVKASALAKVAGTGSYTDLSNKPVMAAVASSGSYTDLKDTPSFPTVGKSCGTGLFMKGFKADGSLDCLPLIETDMPADGLDEVSNGLISNQFDDMQPGTPDVQIPDGLGAGKTDTMTFPDIGLAQKVWIDMTIDNSDLSGVKIELYGPAMANPYVLYDGGKSGVQLKAKFNDELALVSGDMNKDWLGKNIKGLWSITVKDLKAGGGAGGMDGKFNWSIHIQTLSNQKVHVVGNLLVDGSVSVGKDTADCDGVKKGALRNDPTYGLEECNGIDWIAAIPRKPMWSGGCKSTSSGGGEATYCLDGLDFNTMDKYLSINTNGTVTVNIDGYYRVNVYMDGLTNSYRRMMFRRTPKGGAEVDFAYAHLYETSAGWHFISLDTTWPFKKGDTFRVVGQNDNANVRWHSWNAYGQHSRAQFSYEGPLNN